MFLAKFPVRGGGRGGLRQIDWPYDGWWRFFLHGLSHRFLSANIQGSRQKWRKWSPLQVNQFICPSLEVPKIRIWSPHLVSDTPGKFLKNRLLGASTIRLAHSVVTASMTSLQSIWSISTAAKCLMIILLGEERCAPCGHRRPLVWCDALLSLFVSDDRFA